MSERNVLKHITKTRNIQSRNIYNYSIVCVVFCEIGQCIAVCVSQWFLSSVSRCIKLTFHDSFSKFWDSVYTRGSPEEDRCCVHVLPISSEALWGEKRKILKVREELRLGTCQSTFFSCFWRCCRRQLLPRHVMPRRTVHLFILFKNIKKLQPGVFIFGFLKVWEELQLGTCQSTFFLAFVVFAIAPHYALQNRRIYLCILFKNIKLL